MAKLPTNYAGKVRRSQMATIYGPGAIINLRSPSGAPISAVTGGQEIWDHIARPPGLKNPQRCYLLRLQRKLDVSGFRLPPVMPEQSNDERTMVALAGQRFPDWLTCPKCFRLNPSKKWAKNNHQIDVARWCGHCSTTEKKTYVVPVRFVFTCINGHLSEFPWSWWLSINNRSNKLKKELCQVHRKMYLKQGNSMSLASLNLSCSDCGAFASMGTIFGHDTFKNFKCGGYRPWLGDVEPEKCGKAPVAVQRNSSSLYLPKYESALDIPPWSHKLAELLSDWWPRIYKIDLSESRFHKIDSNIEDINEECGTAYTSKQLNDEIQKLKDLDENSDPELRIDEYNQFINVDSLVCTNEFAAKSRSVPSELSEFINIVLSVERLREVRANYGFTRLKDNNPLCDISNEKKDWLPAIEVRGEGLFVDFKSDFINKWASNALIKARIDKIKEIYERDTNERNIPKEKRLEINPCLIFIHSISHLLIRQISLVCGYSASSLRERLYVSDEMQGILIYTATADSEGTLGGLSRLALQKRFREIFISAIGGAVWCSSDPLCIEGALNHSEPLNHAACHACMMLPETSCEIFNVFLDRSLISGDKNSGIPGIFEELINYE